MQYFADERANGRCDLTLNFANRLPTYFIVCSIILGHLLLSVSGMSAMTQQAANSNTANSNAAISHSNDAPKRSHASCHESVGKNLDETKPSQSSWFVTSDCCGDDCQCPLGSCSPVSIVFLVASDTLAIPRPSFTFANSRLVQLRQPPLLPPPIA